MATAVPIIDYTPFKPLKAKIVSLGYLERTLWNYTVYFAIFVALGVAAFAQIYWGEGAIYYWLSILTLALFWMQSGFLGHDAAHYQMSGSKETNRRLGMFFFPILLGMAYRPWQWRHELHHRETNIEEVDSDLENKLLVYTKQRAREKRSQNWLFRTIARYQAPLYPVLTMFATIGFRIDAWRYVTGLHNPFPSEEETKKFAGERRFELALLVVNAVLWLVVPVFIFGFWRWYSILLPTQGLFGIYMASVFAPNHKGMPQYKQGEQPNSWLDHQVLTSRNMVVPDENPLRFILQPLLDWAYGGLNYQVEHHLFRMMPRRFLAAARAITREYCREIGLEYTEDSFLEAWSHIFGYLNEMGQVVGGKEIEEDLPMAA